MQLEGTTIVAVNKNGKIAVGGDGQVTMGKEIVFKGNARKVRRIYNNEVVIGFAGGTADAFSLEGKFEDMLQKFNGNLMKASVELAMQWRRDEAARQLDAMMIVADKNMILIITGNGDVFDPEDGIAAIGSGGNYALAAAKALSRNTNMQAKDIVKEAMKIAGEICVFTNDHIIVEEV